MGNVLSLENPIKKSYQSYNNNLTLDNTGEKIVTTGRRSGSFQSAHTVGTSPAAVSMMMGTLFTANTLTVSALCKTTFMQIAVDFAGTKSFTFSSFVDENSSCIRFTNCFLDNINNLNVNIHTVTPNKMGNEQTTHLSQFLRVLMDFNL